MARVLIREAHGGATRVISDVALPYFQNSGWVVIDTQDDSTDASPLYLSKAESDLRYAKKDAVAAGAVYNSNGTPNATKRLHVKLTADGTDIDDIFIEDVS